MIDIRLCNKQDLDALNERSRLLKAQMDRNHGQPVAEATPDNTAQMDLLFWRSAHSAAIPNL